MTPIEPPAPAAAAPTRSWLLRNFHWVVLAVTAGYLLSVFGRMNPPKAPYNLAQFARTPVVDHGRVKPLETAARIYLRMISGREEFEDEAGRKHPAIEWYAELLDGLSTRDGAPARTRKVFQVNNEQVLSDLGLPPREGLRYSYDELIDKMRAGKIAATLAKVREKRREKKPLDLYETKLAEVENRLAMAEALADFGGGPLLVPPAAEGENWLSIEALQEQARAEAFSAVTSANQLTAERMAFMSREDKDRFAAEFTREAARRIPEKLAPHPAALAWKRLVAAYHEQKPEAFNEEVANYQATYLSHVPPRALERVNLEVVYDRFAPFYQCIGLYVIVFFLSVTGFVLKGAELPAWSEALRRSGVLVLAAALVVHVAALGARMYLMDRPLVFVTNLYSSAVFIGAGCVLIGLVLEWLFPLGIGSLIAAALGVATTIVAHNLATEDTLEMMQAVLDTNFWLATHVTTVTFGYTATFVAGFLGAVYVYLMLASVVRESFLAPGQPSVGALLSFGAAVLGLVLIPLFFLWFLITAALAKLELVHSSLPTLLFFVMGAGGVVYALTLLFIRATAEGVDAHGAPVAGAVPPMARPLTGVALDADVSKVLGQMMYGIVCFATLLSFVGTVLGGIWADQSWGRFWGWDPKENGAVLIVLWNALILHARWAGMIKVRGLAVTAVVGNMICAWSWFGTNQLGIGLHAYGFDTGLADGCTRFWVSQLLIIGVGLIPQQYWTAAARRAPAATAGAPVASANGQPRERGRPVERKR